MVSFIKSVVSIVLLCSFVLQVAANLLLWTHYEWNKIYISKVLCEKKDIPDSCCKGKCFLKKQVEKQEELPNTTNTTSQKQKSIKYQVLKDTFLENIAYLFEKKHYNSMTFVLFSEPIPNQHCLESIEKPPQVSFYS